MPSLRATPTSRYWFPAKRYGWGWGLPCAWQGWATLAAYVVALSMLPLTTAPEFHPARCGGGVLVLSTLLITVCWLKGEPPGWRWGNGRSNR